MSDNCSLKFDYLVHLFEEDITLGVSSTAFKDSFKEIVQCDVLQMSPMELNSKGLKGLGRVLDFDNT